MKNISGVVLLLCAGMVSASDDTSYYCVTEESTGFSLRGYGEWASGPLDTREMKFIIRKLKSDEQVAAWKGWPYGAFDFGSNTNVLYCRNNGEGGNQFVYCEGLGELYMNKKDGRFIRTSPFGYWNEDLVGSDITPAIHRGSCVTI